MGQTTDLTRIQPTTIYRSFASSSRYFAEADSAAPLSPKIAPLVDQISTLSLLEVSELVTALKTKLNITEVAMPSSAAPAAGAAPVEAAEEVEKPKEKTIFTVKLEKFDAGAKAKIIREVKALMPNMNLVEVSLYMLRSCSLAHQVGKEICRVGTTDFEGELAKGRGREIAKDLDGSRSYHLVIVGVDGQRHVSCDYQSIFCYDMHSILLLVRFPLLNLRLLIDPWPP